MNSYNIQEFFNSIRNATSKDEVTFNDFCCLFKNNKTDDLIFKVDVKPNDVITEKLPNSQEGFPIDIIKKSKN